MSIETAADWNGLRAASTVARMTLDLLAHAVRQPDPYYRVEGGWIIRRLGPHCGRIDQANVSRRKDERQILIAMGREIANLHLARTGRRDEVLKDLAGRKPGWLLKAARKMAAATEDAWHEFRGSKLAQRG